LDLLHLGQELRVLLVVDDDGEHLLRRCLDHDAPLGLGHSALPPLNVRCCIPRWRRSKRGGCSNRGSSARTSIPPITTMASGFCVSLPIPRETAAGKRPMSATEAVMSAGRRPRSAARRAPSSSEWPSRHIFWA